MGGVMTTSGHEMDDAGRGSRIVMSPSAKLYLAALGVATAGVTVALLLTEHVNGDVVGRFAAVAAGAAIAQLFVVRAPRNQTYHTTIVFLLAAVLLLPAAL